MQGHLHSTEPEIPIRHAKMTTPTATPLPALPLRPSDLRGLSRLGVDGTLGITDLVEAMHHTIASHAGIAGTPLAGRTGGITGLVYGAVRGSTRVVGKGLDMALGLVQAPDQAEAGTPAREAFVSVLNGLFGDHLADSGNPLAIPMVLRVGGVPFDLDRLSMVAPNPPRSGRLLVLAHGLCMNDLQWARNGTDHGQVLAHALGFTPLYLHYNSGRHVSQNGRDFALLLERLVTHWPVPVEELVIVGHSMGGLVARSACHLAAGAGHGWLARLKQLVFLGTPHHGAPLERGGRWIDVLLAVSPYAAPFARLGKARSAGITDLRFGNLQDADWAGRDRHSQQHDDRHPTPLPAGGATYVVAATLAENPGRVHRAVIGDGLVPLDSALGEHRDAALALQVPAANRHIVAECGHLDLLCHPKVQVQLLDWLGAPPRR